MHTALKHGYFNDTPLMTLVSMHIDCALGRNRHARASAIMAIVWADTFRILGLPAPFQFRHWESSLRVDDGLVVIMGTEAPGVTRAKLNDRGAFQCVDARLVGSSRSWRLRCVS